MISFSLSRCKGTKKIGNTKQFSFLFYAPSNVIIGFSFHCCIYTVFLMLHFMQHVDY